MDSDSTSTKSKLSNTENLSIGQKTQIETNSLNTDKKSNVTVSSVVKSISIKNDIKSTSLDENRKINVLEWQNITVYGPRKRKLFSKLKNPRPLILDNVSGSAENYKMTAFMGASGAGKSSLLNILSMTINNKLKASGRILFNGETANIRNIASYVPQTDLFFSHLTVSEHIMFNIEMNYGSKMNKTEKTTLLNEMLNRFNIKRCCNIKIGNPIKGVGISGGERRRLSLASELIKKPKILFADEPTSGLDNFMALTVVKSLYEMSSDGIIVICVIHQPSSQIFAAFDQVYLMAEGRTVFGGSLDLCNSIFIKADLPCPVKFNPADHYIEMIAISPENEDLCRQRVEHITKTWLSETDTNSVKKREEKPLRNHPPKFLNQKYAASGIRQFSLLFERSFKITSREPLITYIRLAQTVLISIIIGLIYLQLDYTVSKSQSFFGVLFFILTNNSFMNLFMVINTFPLELNIFRKEHNNRMYRTSYYFFQRTFIDLPLTFIMTVISTLITYWMIGLYPSASAYFYHLLVVYLVVLSATSYGYFISAIANSPVTATIISAPLMLPLLIFGGFFIQNDAIPVYFIWIEYISWFKYGFELLSLIQYDKAIFKCDNDLICVSQGVSEINGRLLVENFGFSYDHLTNNIIALVMIAILFRVLSLLIIILKTYLSER